MSPTGYRSKREIYSIIATLAGVLLLLTVAFVARYLVLASLVGIGFGVLIAPIMNRMQGRYQVPRGLSALVLVILILGSTAAVGYGVYALVADQASSLIASAPQLVKTIERQADKLLQSSPWLETQISQLNLGDAAKSTANTLFQGVQTSLTTLGGFILLLTVAVFTAINSRAYFRGFLSFFPAYQRPRVAEVMHESAVVLRKWLRCQLVVMVVSGSMTTLALWLLGIDYWLLLGVLTGVLGFIPYIGSFITVIATGLVTLGSEPDKIWWVLGVYLGIQQLEGNVTIPLIMKGGVRLPEVPAIVFMLIMGSLFGLLGVFVAPPLLAVGKQIFMATYVRAMDQKTVPLTEERRQAA